MFPKNTRAEAHAHSQRLWQHRQSSSQTGSQRGDGEVDTKFSSQEAICNCYLLGKGLRFHQLNITSDINSPEQATGPKVVGKHKPDSTAGFVVLCCACRQVCILCLCTRSCTFCLWWFLVLLFGWFGFLWGSERLWSWMDREWGEDLGGVEKGQPLWLKHIVCTKKY